MKRLSLVVVLLFFAACEAEYEVPSGHPVAAGAAGVGHSTMYIKEKKDQDASSPKDSTTGPADAEGEAGAEDAGGDGGCTETPAVCECLEKGEEYFTVPYCVCKQTEAQDHPGNTNWCDCNHLVCADDSNDAHRAAMLMTCAAMQDFTDQCTKYF
ncbi:MAG: hypothetical protein FJ109_02900 [Deltaproteobacteria bacterium]|nr:hypothetical protein [Deltaproteobacteria bacterium]